MNSTTLLAEALQSHDVVLAVGFQYGSKHNPYEINAARAIASFYKVKYRRIDIQDAFDGSKSALMEDIRDVPEGYYEGENMRATVVPGRNLIFASIAAAIAESAEAQFVFMGIHAGDHHIYPDCRPEFALALGAAIKASSDGKVDLAVPFLRFHKEHILKRGFELSVPYDMTRTCYKDQYTACGKCGSCQERLAAFAKLGQKDPIPYETRVLIPQS
jgi:7-cyano-7-deazaguanine synthase